MGSITVYKSKVVKYRFGDALKPKSCLVPFQNKDQLMNSYVIMYLTKA